VSNQLQILELSLLYSVVGADRMEKLIHSSTKYEDRLAKKDDSGFFGNIMRSVKTSFSPSDDSLLYKVASSLLPPSPTPPPSSSAIRYHLRHRSFFALLHPFFFLF